VSKKVQTGGFPSLSSILSGRWISEQGAISL
jgi:hypothetical protein